MTQAALLGLATATPAYQHAQMELYDRWLAPYLNSQRARAIFAAAQIETRYSVLATSDFLANEPGTKARNDAYMQAARPLALETIKRALAQAGLGPSDINHFIVISCTGFDTPGLDVILAAELGLHPQVRRSALVGMGCHAGLTGLDRASLEIAARPASNVLLLALEFGTLHFQHGGTLANMVASAIFSDGLAAAIIGPGLPGGNRPRLLHTMTYSDYNLQELMGFHISDTGYQIHLSARVPTVLQAMLPPVIEEFLQQAGLTIATIKFWGIHPGGAKIIDYIAQALELPAAALVFSRQVLRRYGNMSSAAIFFVLEAIIQQGRPQAGDYALLLSFGPGLTIELCLVKW